MFCTHCGNELSADAKFCTACGTPITVEEVKTEKEETTKKVFETQKTKPKGKFEMVLDSFVTVAGFIVVGFTVLGIVGAIISLF